MKQYLDIENWPRKDHFYFFKEFTEPFFGVTVKIDCTKAYQYTKSSNTSFFLYYLHKVAKVVNEIDCFRYRIENDTVAIYDKINISATIGRPNGTFDFSNIAYDKLYSNFEENGRKEIERIQNSTGLNIAVSGNDVIHFSALPWLNFSSFSHARSLSFPDSCPKISFGKLMDHDGVKTVSVSIHVHHGLMDGLHVGQFVDTLQKFMNE